MEKGITYMVRPRMLPAKRPLSVARISFGSRQLLVGPASSGSTEQMNVRASTRATSLGSLRARKLYGRNSGFRRMRVPDSTMRRVSRSYSCADPSHQWMLSGWVSSAISATQVTTERGAFSGAAPAGLSWSLTGVPARFGAVSVMCPNSS